MKSFASLLTAALALSKEAHENRNIYNELPKGVMVPTAEDNTLWVDEAGRDWKQIEDPFTAYHQPMPVPVAFVRGYVGKVLPFLEVPNLKFLSPNTDGRFSEICANRYTGELVIDQQLLGTFNFCTDAPDAMTKVKLPTTGEHDELDIIPHKEYGGNYQHIAKDLPVGTLTKGPVVLGALESPNYGSLVLTVSAIALAFAASSDQIVPL